ncbi:MAG: hypothetical protein KKC99_13140 [Proteobacteria bacterium]|nr:hypothetical protein [Pseudomonadota bacterium]
MASRKPNFLEHDAEKFLGPGPVRAAELVAIIHAVNPTGLNLPPGIMRRRYELKSKLQSRLIIDFFSELTIEVVPKEPGVIGLRYRPQDRDACHAVVAELSEEARSKVQFHLDTAEGGPTPTATRAATGPGSSRHRTGLLAEGRKALTDFDYYNAKLCFEEALGASEDDDAAAIALLEVLVDKLALWDEALALEERLTPEQLTPPVRTLLAVAAAFEGNAPACLRLAKGLDTPRVAEAVCSLATQALKRSDFPEAQRFLSEARLITGSAIYVVAVEAELSRLKTAQREPAERELESLLASGEEARAEEKARALIERWPESSVARRVVREAEERRRTATLSSMGEQAQAAFDAGDDSTALALWGEALQLGATGLEKKLAAASARLHARERAKRIADVVSCLGEGLGTSSLGRYLDLDISEREEVRKLTGEEALEWLEEMGASGSREWKLDAAAVMTLKEVKAKPHSATDAVVLLRPIETRVRRLEAGRALLAAAEVELRESALSEARAHLQSARAALTEGRWRAAIELVEGLQASAGKDISEEARRIVAEALGKLETESRRERFENLVQHGNHLEALHILRAAEADEAEDKSAWAKRRETVSRALRDQLQVEVFKSPNGLSAGDALAGAGLIEVSYGLDDKGEYAYLATGLGRHLFVRKLSIREQCIVEMVALTMPLDADYPDVRVEGETLWLNTAGMALELAIKDWVVLRYHAFKVAEGEVVEMGGVTPGGRFLWLDVRSRESGEEVLHVTDLEKSSPPKVMPKEGLTLEVLATSRGPRMWISGFKRGGRIFGLGGATELTLPVGLQEVAIGPGGSGFFGVALPEDRFEEPIEENSAKGAAENEDDGEDEKEGLKVLLVREGGNESQLIEELQDAFVDGLLQVATALDAGVSFVVYASDEDCWLVAYSAEGNSLKRRWRVRCPEKGLLLQDIDARRVVLVTPHNNGLRCVPLTAEEPNLHELVGQPKETHVPRLLHDGPSCSTGYDSALAKATEVMHKSSGPSRRKVLERTLAEYQDKPEGLSYLAKDLRRWGMPAEAAEVTSVTTTRFPTHAWVKFDAAEAAVEKGDWSLALEALDAVSEQDLSLKKRVHGSHLGGLALFHLNRLEEAREAFAVAATQEGTGCHVSGWPEWLDALLGKSSQSTARRLLEIVRKADVALASGQTNVALELLDVPLVWGCLDVQLAARLATAALAEPTGPRTKLMLAALVRQRDSRRTVTLPFGNLAWTKEQIDAVEERARTWLELAGKGFRSDSDHQ